MGTSYVRRALFVAYLLSTTLTVAAAPAGDPKIGLVLGGGGARGAAHVGVLRELEKMRIPIHCVAGTSMGAVVGGLYAAGMTPDEMEQVLGDIDWPRIFQDAPHRQDRSFRRKRDDDRFLVKGAVGVDETGLKFPLGVIQGQNISLLFEQLTARASQVSDFDDLRIPFRAVATDLATGEPFVLDGGALATAMRASMSIPGALAPVTVDGHLLVDGGVSNNLPIDVVRETCADIVIAVSLGTPLKPVSELSSLFAVTDQLTTIMTQQNTERQIATLSDHDVLIEPELGTLGTTDFDKSREAVPLGDKAVAEVAARLAHLAVSNEEYRKFLPGYPTEADRHRVVNYVRIENDSGVSDEVIASKLRIQPGDRLDTDLMEQDIAKIYGLGLFESVDYVTEVEDGEDGVVVRARATSWGPNFLQFGLSLEDDLEGNAIFNVATALAVTQINDLNAEWRTEVQLGQFPIFSTDFYQPLDAKGQFFVDPLAFYRRFDLGIFNEGKAETVYRITETGAALTGGMNFDTWGELRLGIFRGTGTNSVKVGSPDLPEDDFDAGGYFARFTVDTLNNIYFPTEGTFMPIEYNVSDTRLGADDDYQTLQAQLTQGYSWGKHSLVGNFRFGYTVEGDLPLQSRFALGGFLNLSGFARRELSGQYLGFGAMAYYYRLDDASSILTVPVYLGASLEAGNTWQDSGDFNFDDLIPAGSLFVGADTPLGPFYLARGQAEGGRSTWYVFLGRTF